MRTVHPGIQLTIQAAARCHRGLQRHQRGKCDRSLVYDLEAHRGRSVPMRPLVSDVTLTGFASQVRLVANHLAAPLKPMPRPSSRHVTATKSLVSLINVGRNGNSIA